MDIAYEPEELIKGNVIGQGLVLRSSLISNLDREFTREDVRLALNDIADDKSSGVNGHIAAFFKKS
ncbi:hypothetical protein Dimus_013029, partial [Dionaea muscipula]